MINKDELLLTVNQFNQPVTPLPRHEVHERKLWHRTTHIWIINNDNQILCQQRSQLKDISPGKWEAHFGGHILAKEHEEQNAINELFEELGLRITKEDLHFFQIYASKNNQTKHFQYIYYVFWNGERKNLTLEQEEIDMVKWYSLDNLIDTFLIKKDPLWVIHGYEKKLLDYFTHYGFSH